MTTDDLIQQLKSVIARNENRAYNFGEVRLGNMAHDCLSKIIELDTKLAAMRQKPVEPCEDLTKKNDKDAIVSVLENLLYRYPALGELSDAIKIVQAYQPTLKQMKVEPCEWCQPSVQKEYIGVMPLNFVEFIEYDLDNGEEYHRSKVRKNYCPDCGRRLDGE